VRPVYVLSAARTPIGKFGGAFAELTAAELGAAAARAAIERSGLPASAVDEAIFGHGRQAGGGPNTARQASHRAGVPDSVPAFTVNKACASSLKAITLGALTIAAVVAFENVDQSLHTPPGHAFVWVDIQACNLRAAGEMMEQAATISDFRIEQGRIGRERLFLEHVERCARNDFFFQGLREGFLVHDWAT